MTAPGVHATTLLVIVAHPDDESLACGALLARCAALGMRVVVVSLTRGEAGPSHAATTAPLAGVRAQELRAAADALGIGEVVLRDYEDGMLPWVDADAIAADLDGLLAQYRPTIVVTFGADGLYWHPDHIAVHEHVTAAVVRAGAGAPALYYVTLPPGQMRAVVARAGGTRPVVPGLDDPDAFGAAAEPPTLIVAAGAFAARKLAAIRAHRSQFGESAFGALTDDDAHLLDVEHFHRAAVGAAGPTALDALGSSVPAAVTPPSAH